jgi:hypothetical protein
MKPLLAASVPLRLFETEFARAGFESSPGLVIQPDELTQIAQSLVRVGAARALGL